MSPTPIGQSVLARALLDPGHPVPAGMQAWNRSDPAVRFAVHRNNVLAALVAALADNFPVVEQLVGEPFFRAMAGVFVRQLPPRPGALSLYGCHDDRWPAFIQDFAPARSVPYLADVARLEAAWQQSLHSLDAEPLRAQACLAQQRGGVALEALRLLPHPSMRLVRFEHAALSVWAAHQTEGDVTLAHIDVHAAEAAVLLRPASVVQVLPVPVAQWPGPRALLSALQAGLTLGDAGRAALSADPRFDLTAHLGELLSVGALTALTPANPSIPIGDRP